MGQSGMGDRMTTILAIDTSAGTSVAIVRDGEVLSEHSIDEIRRHAEVVGDLIVRCLSDAGITAADITDVVAGRGPGPFTGLRVGIAAAIAFAVGRTIPLHGVVSHDAVAWGRAEPCTVVTDARRREIAVSSYAAGGVAHRVAGPTLTTNDELATVADLPSYPECRADTISAAALALRAEAGLRLGIDFSDHRAIYLRAPDAVPSAGPKKVLS